MVLITFCDFKDLDLHGKKHYFPFLMASTFVKPIISYNQIKIISDAFNRINNSDILIVIGYGMDYSDYHIISMIKSFITS